MTAQYTWVEHTITRNGKQHKQWYRTLVKEPSTAEKLVGARPVAAVSITVPKVEKLRSKLSDALEAHEAEVSKIKETQQAKQARLKEVDAELERLDAEHERAHVDDEDLSEREPGKLDDEKEQLHDELTELETQEPDSPKIEEYLGRLGDEFETRRDAALGDAAEPHELPPAARAKYDHWKREADTLEEARQSVVERIEHEGRVFEDADPVGWARAYLNTLGQRETGD